MNIFLHRRMTFVFQPKWSTLYYVWLIWRKSRKWRHFQKDKNLEECYSRKPNMATGLFAERSKSTDRNWKDPYCETVRTYARTNIRSVNMPKGWGELNDEVFRGSWGRPLMLSHTRYILLHACVHIHAHLGYIHTWMSLFLQSNEHKITRYKNWKNQ